LIGVRFLENGIQGIVGPIDVFLGVGVNVGAFLGVRKFFKGMLFSFLDLLLGTRYSISG